MKNMNLTGFLMVIVTGWLLFAGGCSAVNSWTKNMNIGDIQQKITTGYQRSVNFQPNQPVNNVSGRSYTNQQSIQAQATNTPATIAAAPITGSGNIVTKDYRPTSGPVTPSDSPFKQPEPTAIPKWVDPPAVPVSEYRLVNLGKVGSPWYCLQIPSINKQVCSTDPFWVDNPEGQALDANLLKSGLYPGEPVGTMPNN